VTRQAVIDSCVCVKWLIKEDHSEKAMGLLASDLELVAPDLVLTEAANVLWKTVRRGLLTPEQADARLTDLPSFFNRLLPTFDLVPEALALGMVVDLPVYDCAYVVASRRTGANLVTADSKLIAKLAGTPDHTNTVHIADWK
jgi:predicted nucleic acid-binding protein